MSIFLFIDYFGQFHPLFPIVIKNFWYMYDLKCRSVIKKYVLICERDTILKSIAALPHHSKKKAHEVMK